MKTVDHKEILTQVISFLENDYARPYYKKYIPLAFKLNKLAHNLDPLIKTRYCKKCTKVLDLQKVLQTGRTSCCNRLLNLKSLALLKLNVLAKMGPTE